MQVEKIEDTHQPKGVVSFEVEGAPLSTFLSVKELADYYSLLERLENVNSRKKYAIFLLHAAMAKEAFDKSEASAKYDRVLIALGDWAKNRKAEVKS